VVPILDALIAQVLKVMGPSEPLALGRSGVIGLWSAGFGVWFVACRRRFWVGGAWRRGAQNRSVPANIAEGRCKESNRPRPVGEALLAETTRLRKMLFVLLRRVRRATPAPARHAPTAPDLRPEASNRAPHTNDR
jgi:hypothetical protein